MKRRNALAYLALSIGGAAVLPGCWSREWRRESLPAHGLNITPQQETLLAELVETIIPEGEAPGARSLGVNEFILTMVSDCSDKQAHEEFAAGFQKLEDASQAKFGKKISALAPEQRTEALRYFLKSEDPAEAEAKAFVSFLKKMTVQGYMNSEYVMTNVLHYKHIPGRFEGCAPVTKNISA
jgi:hypothetical protein